MPTPKLSSPDGGRKTIKYVVVTGGVISGVGKGIITSSTGVLLRGLGLRVSAIKIDPYLNIDAGTLSPYDHGILGDLRSEYIIIIIHLCRRGVYP